MKTVANKKNILITLIAICAIFLLKLIDEENLNLDTEYSGDVTVLVTRVVDGDTFDIESGERVRLIGMDTPERGKFLYREATDELKHLVENKKVILKKDVSEVDRYGRLLRHVYIGDKWINKQMIETGYAKFVTFPPDVYHVEEFKQAEKKARKNEVGLWEAK